MYIETIFSLNILDPFDWRILSLYNLNSGKNPLGESLILKNQTEISQNNSR
jgi:hypothetical protein